MNIGKLTNRQLKEIVFSHITRQRDDIPLRADIGEDCAGVRFGESVCVLSTDPITIAHDNLGYLGVHISVNDVASSGGEPVAIMVTLLAPPSTEKQELSSVMEQLTDTCNELGIELVGGHTEITDAVNRVILSTTVIGRVDEIRLIKSSGARPGDSLIMTKWTGLEGTAILANDHKQLAYEILDRDELRVAQNLLKSISVLPEARAASQMHVSAMHDVTEGGIFGAAWEMAEAAGLGLEIYRHNIPVLPATHILCGALNIDCYRLIGSGSLLIATDRPDKLLSRLEDENILASEIGKFKAGNTRIIITHGDPEILHAPERDEIYKINVT